MGQKGGRGKRRERRKREGREESGIRERTLGDKRGIEAEQKSRSQGH